MLLLIELTVFTSVVATALLAVTAACPVRKNLPINGC